MNTVLLKGLPTLYINGRPLPLKKSKRARAKRGRRFRKARAIDETSESTTPKSEDSSKKTSQSAPEVRVNGAPATPQPKPVTAVSLPSKIFSKSGQTLQALEVCLDAMKFVGPAPELINGRCAMVGIPAAVVYERFQNLEFFSLITEHKILFSLVVAFISVASLIPIVKEAKMEGFGFLTPSAEMTNGRAAMIGILALIIFEAKIGTNFF